MNRRLSIEHFRRLSPRFASLPEDRQRELLDRLYMLAEVAIREGIRRERKKQEKSAA